MRYVENGVPEDFARITFRGLNVPLRELSEEEYNWVVFGIKKKAREKRGGSGITIPEIYTNNGTKSNEELPLDILELSVRADNCLRRANIGTISELCAMSESELTRIRNMGVKTVREVKSKLSALGYSLRTEE